MFNFRASVTGIIVALIQVFSMPFGMNFPHVLLNNLVALHSPPGQEILSHSPLLLRRALVL